MVGMLSVVKQNVFSHWVQWKW